MKAHDSLTPFQQQDHQLMIGDKTLSHIEMLVGRTPFYVYDRQTLGTNS